VNGRVLDAVVVGGGIAGLAAAYELRRRGAGVQLLEAAPRPGGVIVADTVYVTDIPAFEGTVYHVPLTDMADALGLRRVANIVSLAVFAKISGIVAIEALEKAVEARSPLGSSPCSMREARELSTSRLGPVASENGCRMRGGSIHTRVCLPSTAFAMDSPIKLFLWRQEINQQSGNTGFLQNFGYKIVAR